MAASDFIPVGRTSLVKKGAVSLQVQTEYASRPNPRITTSILNNGQMLHKVERTLDKPVTTPEEQLRVETTIRRQHAEIIAIIEGNSYHVPPSERTQKDAVESVTPQRLAERIAVLPGVQKVYQVDGDVNFMAGAATEQFRKMFAVVFKNLRELMDLFSRLPGVGVTREKGVYEVERDRLYMLSAGTEFFFILVRRIDMTTDFEKLFKSLISDNPF